LPNTRLKLGISFKYFLRCGGFDDRRGVLPDIIAEEDPQSKAKGIDRTIQVVLEMLSNAKR